MKKVVFVKDVAIGDGSIVLQSMTNTDTEDAQATIRQINELANAGAQLVRVSVPNKESAYKLKEIVSGTSVPIIADIHFSDIPALIAIENGASKIRINPYNMSKDAISEVVKKCIEYNVPIRIGVNKGSSSDIKTPRDLAESAVECAKMIEDLGWDRLVLSVKSSDVKETVKAYRTLYEITDYPLHIGLTESGTKTSGTLKSAIAIGALLLDNIGDTIRVSLPGDPVEEIRVAHKILRAVGRDKNFVEIIACPTCARTKIDVEHLANDLEKLTENVCKPVKIAVMGCVVNGIGESKDADFGVAGGKEKSMIFKNGNPYKTIDNKDIKNELINLLKEHMND